VSRASSEMWKQMKKTRGGWVRLLREEEKEQEKEEGKRTNEATPLVDHVIDVLRDAMYLTHTETDVHVRDSEDGALTVCFEGRKARKVPHVDQVAENKRGQEFLMDSADPLSAVLFLRPRAKWAKSSSSSTVIAVAFEMVKTSVYNPTEEGKRSKRFR